MKHGFKAKANRQSADLRKQLGLKLNDPIDCFELAKHIKVPTFAAKELEDAGFDPNSLKKLCLKYARPFSATTILLNHLTPLQLMIVYNHEHTPQRTNNDVSHEIAHVICEHDFREASKTFDQSREFNKEKEDEANWLAGCILLPEEGLVWAVKRKMTLENISDHFNVSLELARMRYNQTGMERRKRYWN